MKTAATLFTGGGLADIGIQAAGYELIWGIEYDPKKWKVEVADWAKSQLRHNIVPSNILEVYPGYLARPDHLHASPPCPSFSTANNKRGEKESDLELARKIAEFIMILQPDTFTLENVYMYRKSQSWQIIKEALTKLGYVHDFEHINFANLGVPQTRKRMIVRASLLGPIQPMPEPEPWMGWYQAIEDLIAELPDTNLAPWQLKRLKEKGFIFDGFVTADGYIDQSNRLPMPGPDDPVTTITAATKGHRALLLGQGNWSELKPDSVPGDSVTSNSNQTGIKAILIEGVSKGARTPTRKTGEEPSFTIEAGGGGRLHRAILVPGGNVTSFPARHNEQPSPTIGDVNRSGNTPKALLVGHSTSNALVPRHSDDPATMVTQNSTRKRALLVGGGSAGKNIPTAEDGERRLTIKANLVKEKHRAILLDDCRIVAITPRCLARFQTLPDWYQLPEKKSLAVTIIGNGVPSLGIQKIMDTFKAS